jgi:hypothetical protein
MLKGLLQNGIAPKRGRQWALGRCLFRGEVPEAALLVNLRLKLGEPVQGTEETCNVLVERVI